MEQGTKKVKVEEERNSGVKVIFTPTLTADGLVEVEIRLVVTGHSNEKNAPL